MSVVFINTRLCSLYRTLFYRVLGAASPLTTGGAEEVESIFAALAVCLLERARGFPEDLFAAETTRGNTVRRRRPWRGANRAGVPVLAFLIQGLSGFPPSYSTSASLSWAPWAPWGTVMTVGEAIQGRTYPQQFCRLIPAQSVQFV